nr:type III effector HopX1 [Pseudomonas cannabina pv. alisalensis]
MLDRRLMMKPVSGSFSGYHPMATVSEQPVAKPRASESPQSESIEERPACLAPVAGAGQPLPGASSSLSAYLLLRRLDHRPVSQEGINALTPADEAVVEARNALPFGRGNVGVDAQKTDLESSIRTRSVMRLTRDAEAAGHTPMRGVDADMNWNVLVAMSGRIFGAGNCREHARIASFAYGGLAQESGRSSEEKIHLATKAGVDHVWVETDHPDADSSPMVIDPWANGSAILAEDSRFAKDRSAVTRTDTFDLSLAAEAGQIAKATAEEALAHTQGRLQQRLASERPDAVPLESGRYREEVSVLDDTFARRVGQKVNTADPRGMLNVELEAVGVAMSLGGEGVKPLTQEASQIVEKAKKFASPGGMPRDA